MGLLTVGGFAMVGASMLSTSGMKGERFFDGSNQESSTSLGE